MDFIDILRFWLVIQLFALAALPLAWRWLAPLPSRGYALAKPLGLLLVSYLLWLGASLGFLRNGVGGILLAWAVVLGASLWLGRASWQRDDSGQRPLFSWLREHWVLVAVTEILFLAALVGWAFIRSFSPEITTAGGEKFMELTFLNGILRSQQFPPQDPWLSGFAISYYYFGYVMLAALARLSGLPASVAFNVGLGAWFALTLTAAFGIAFDLVAALIRRAPVSSSLPPASSPPVPRSAYIGGLLGALFVGLLGNLAGFLESMFSAGVGPLAFWRWLDVKDLNCLGGPGYSEPIANCLTAGSFVPDRFFWWWRASRVITDRDLLGNAVEVIDEFPFFSFLLGDMHPHVLALPFVLLAIGIALALLLHARQPASSGRGDRLGSRFPLGWTGFGLAALCLGGLAFLNTWDFPIYLFLVGAALAVRLAWNRGGITWGAVGEALLLVLMLGVAGVLLYLPFYVGFQSQAGGILPNFLFPTRLSQFFVMFGPLLAALLFFLLALSGRDGRGAGFWKRFGGFLAAAVLLPILFLVLLIAAGVATGAGQEFMRRLMELPVVQQQIGGLSVLDLVRAVVARRAVTPWAYLALAGLLAWVGALLARRVAASDVTEEAEAPLYAPSVAFVLLMALTALLLTFSVEFVYLRDTFGTRMNTVFKFYFQAWVLLALAAAFGVVYIARYGGRVVRWVGVPLVTLLVVAGMFYPIFATYTRAEKFQTEPTLDGTAYLDRQQPGDAGAIAWLRANVPGNAVVLEASGGSYTYAGRISAQTGLPTLLGWDGHELQWRGDTVEQDKRRPDIERIYRGAPVGELQALLDKWNIGYVVVGQQERAAFGVTPQAEARLAQAMDLVYDADDVRIYQRRD
ncbi:MAG: hypothetical protein KDI55_02215 [Anaerolineae bacterium]|nr:hypothetical protein [Anaerolineae bacterium]